MREGHDNDIMLLDADGNTVRENVLTAAVHDGIELFNSDDNLVEHNISVDNLATNACGREPWEWHPQRGQLIGDHD